MGLIAATLLSGASWYYLREVDDAIASMQHRILGGSDSAQRPRVLNGGSAWGGIRPAPQGSAAGTASVGPAPVTHVRDGDTIEIGTFALRLANLDCAELGTPQGERAKTRMQALVASTQVVCTLTGATSYDRLIASCHLEDGRDLGGILIREGFCAHYW